MIRNPNLFLVCLVVFTSLLSIGQALTASRRHESLSTRTTRRVSRHLRFENVSRKHKMSNKSPSSLSARQQWYQYSGDEDEEEDGERARQKSVDRPTSTMLDVIGPNVAPSQPKIVVLGATGKIGRLVVRQLLEMPSIDMTVVALVRDADKAIRVLSDDYVVAKRNKGGPKLQIVQGDLVPPEELPGFVEHTEEEIIWREKAQTAADYFGNHVKEYDNREDLPDVNEALEDAIKDCTTVISCVGSVRPTNLWTDVMARPLSRLLRPDVSKWCKDGRHPFYVHYASTRKALGYAEREQLRREAAAIALAEADGVDLDDMIQVPKIRFIRISDLCVGHKPWHFVPLVTNIIQSVVFRYQEMAEELLDRSVHVETIVLRPGDLVDEERDVNTTSIQVCHAGVVPSPARVGREDVASLAVAAAMFQTKKDDGDNYSNDPFHYTLACRWVGQNLDPFPAQGRKGDGFPDAQTALQRALKTIKKNRRRREALKRKKSSSIQTDMILRMADKLQEQRKRLKPHGICVAVPIYLFLGLFFKTMVHPLLQFLPGGKTWVLPALARLNEWTVMMFSFLLTRLMVAMPLLTQRQRFIRF